ncbi:TPA: hypothetical protein I4G13_000474 [Enterobacter cloacae]|nr:hypothetical protein [Enterobacter cloacae]
MKYRCISPVFKGRVNQDNIRFCYRSIPATLLAKLTKGDRDMKKTLLALSLLIMAGCSSMQDLRKEPASNTFQSKKQIDAVAECILAGWQEESQKYGSVFIQPYDGGKTVFTQSQLEMVDLKSDGGITKIEFRHQGGLFAYRINSRIKVIERCI